MSKRHFYYEAEVVQHLFAIEDKSSDCMSVVRRLVLHLFQDARNEGIEDGRRDGFFICDKAVRALEEEAKNFEDEGFKKGFLECVGRAGKKITAEMVKPR
jgi:hypothetical protein